MQISSSSSLTGSALYAAAAAGSVSSDTSISQTTSSATSSSASTTTASIAPAPSSLLSSATLMSILQEANPGSSFTEQYASDPSADPQLVDVSGLSTSFEPASLAEDEGAVNPGVESTADPAAPVSASTISSIESQLGVVAVYNSWIVNGVTFGASEILFTDSGQPVSPDSALQVEWNKMTDAAGQAAAAASSSTSQSDQSSALTSAITQSQNTSAQTIQEAEIEAENQLMATMQQSA